MKTSTEYVIEWKQPKDYDPFGILQKLPSPIARGMREIYNYSVKPEGFYLIDHNVEPQVAAYALKLFLDEALSFDKSVLVRQL